MSRYAIILTGASGSVYGLRVTERLLAAGHDVVFAPTSAGLEVMRFETGLELPETAPEVALGAFIDAPSARLRVAAEDDLFDPIASGTHRLTGLVVVPASMGFVGAMAAGTAEDLPSRAADVALKERRPLVVVSRETPLSLIHLRNLTTLAEAGAVILPACPAFYQRPRTLDDQVDFVAGKVLDVLGIEHDLFARWGE